MENLNMNKARFRAHALKAFVVFMTFVLVMGTSPLTTIAYAMEQNAGDTTIVSVDNTNDSNGTESDAINDATGDGATNTESENGFADDNANTNTADVNGSDTGATTNSTGTADTEEPVEGEGNEGESNEDEGIALTSLDGDNTPVDGKTYGSITYTTNSTKNGFLSEQFSKYRDSGTALGIANSFHIVAFDTLNAPVDVYGNILVKNLGSVVDTGTSEKFVNIYGNNTLSYIQNYSGTFTRWDKSANGCVVFGSNVDITTRNNSELLLNGNRIEKPNTVVQDTDTATNPFIDLDALKSDMAAKQATLAKQADVGATSKTINEGKIRNITINENYEGCAYINLTAKELTSSYEGINIYNLTRKKNASGLVINVDCKGASSITIPPTYLYVGDQKVGIGETDEVFGDTGYVLYNFYNTAENLPIRVRECTASVLAPNASLTLGPGNACGTFIGNNVTVEAESHIRPFHGSTTPSKDEEKEEVSVSVKKVWEDNDNKAQKRPTSVTVQLYTVDANGNLTAVAGKTATLKDGNWSATWDGLQKTEDDKDIAYTVRELDSDGNPVDEGTELANGYKVSYAGEGTYSFTVTNTYTDKVKPETTSVSVKKVWEDNDNEAQKRPTSVTVQLYTVDANGNLTAVAGKTATLKDGSWSATWDGLQKTEDDKDITYTVRELDSDGNPVDEGTELANGYKVSYAGEGTYSFTVTNTYTDKGDEDEDEEAFALSGYSMAAEEAPATDSDKICYVDPKIVKALEGRALKEGEFSFQLIDDATGAVVSETTNDAAGMVDFDKAADVSGNPDNPSCLKFSAAGTYSYTVRETPNQAKDSTVEYSTEVVKFVTTIGANEDGSLYEVESHYVKYANAADAAAGTNGTTYASTVHPTITNKVKPLSLALTKTDAETGKGLEGAVYALYRVDATATNGAVRVMTATSDADGLMVFSGVDASSITEGATYYFQEVSAPAGYTISENKTETFTIERTDDGTYCLKYQDGSTSESTYAATVTDPIVFRAGTGVTDSEIVVTFGKVSSKGTALSGAKLAVRDSAGNDVATWTTDGTGYALRGLTAGEKYTLYEVSAPAGYTKAAEVVFTVDEYGKVSIVDGASKDGVLNAYVEGSALNLVDYKVNELEDKKTVVREVGVPKQKTTTSTASSKGKLPQTGDNSQLFALIAVAGVALGCLGVGTRLRRKE